MTSVTEIEDRLKAVRADVERQDRAEVELERARDQLAEDVRAARAAGARIPELERETGFHRSYIYDLLGPLGEARTAIRRRRRAEVRAQLTERSS